jgi:threonine synthase
MLGLKHLYAKDERQGPTHSFKDRQAALAISSLREMGINEMVVASTGNVAIAYSAYAARAGIKLWAFTISSVPVEKMREVTLFGTELVKVTGTYDQAKQVAERFASSKGLFLDRGVKGIAAKECMKTIAFEVAEELGRMYGPSESGAPWRTSDWYIQAVSGGLGPIGVLKGFRELEQFGLSRGMPKLGNIQSSGCDPMVQGWKANLDEAPSILNPKTRITTVATGVPGLSYKILRRLTLEHGGTFESVNDEDAYRALKTVAQLEGLSVEPATALAFAGLFKMARQRLIDPEEIVVNCSVHISGRDAYPGRAVGPRLRCAARRPAGNSAGGSARRAGNRRSPGGAGAGDRGRSRRVNTDGPHPSCSWRAGHPAGIRRAGGHHDGPANPTRPHHPGSDDAAHRRLRRDRAPQGG